MRKARRAADQGMAAVAARAAQSTSRTFWTWCEDHHADSLAVIVVTLWLTIRVIEWAMDYAERYYDVPGVQIAAIIGAVLTPWGIMQAALFKFYADLKGKATQEKPNEPGKD